MTEPIVTLKEIDEFGQRIRKGRARLRQAKPLGWDSLDYQYACELQIWALARARLLNGNEIPREPR